MALAEPLQRDEQQEPAPEPAAPVGGRPAARRPAPRERALAVARARILLALLFVALVKQLVLVVATPPFQGHDEVAHFGYIWTIDQYGRLPTLDDNLPAALEDYVNFTLDWPALYTANHPPLYYLLVRPVYALAGEDWLVKLYALRLLSILPFLLTVWFAYTLTRRLFPRDEFLALTVPAAVAFQPQIGYEGAIVNNDMLSICFGALLLSLCAAALREGLTARRAAALGVALGLGLLTKTTLTVFLPLVAAVAVWCRWPRPWGRVRAADYWRGTLGRALALVVPLTLLAAPWYLFLKATYGDFSAFAAIQRLQAGWNTPAGTFTELLRSREFHRERIHEYFGYFGWKWIPLDPPELNAVYAGMFLCASGLVVGAARLLAQWLGEGWRRPPPALRDRPRAAGIALLLAANLLMYGAMIYFGTMFQLTQARYIFPVVTATAAVAMLGLRALIPERWTRPAAALTIAALAAFNLLVLTRFVIPYALL